MGSYYNRSAKKTRRDPQKQIDKLRKKIPDLDPVKPEGKLANSWWAQAWNKNLEGYADYASRIGRGRSYVRAGNVVHMTVEAGKVSSLVQGSMAKPYEVGIAIDPLPKATWETVVRQCSRRIGSIEELVSGSFPAELMELFTSKGDGLFPSPKEIHFTCTCPDWAYMCKHVAATLYGVGVRFDKDPTLFFLLRDIDFAALIKKSVDEKMESMLKNAGRLTGRVIADADTFALFGV